MTVMLVTESLCWRLFSLCWWFSQCIKSITNILNRSPASQTCHQHIWSPTSVTNIVVTVQPNAVYPDVVSHHCLSSTYQRLCWHNKNFEYSLWIKKRTRNSTIRRDVVCQNLWNCTMVGPWKQISLGLFRTLFHIGWS